MSQRRKSLSISTRFALEAALERHACLVCTVQERDFERALFWFLEETYSEGPSIDRFVRSQGLCVNHTRLLLRPENNWQMSFVAEILTDYNERAASEALKRAESLRHNALARLFRPRDLGQAFVPRIDCPFCAYLRGSECWALADLTDFADDPEVAAASRYTCLPHVLMAIPMASAAFGASLAGEARRRLDAIGVDSQDPLPPIRFLLGRYWRTTRSAFLPAMGDELLTGARPPANSFWLQPAVREDTGFGPDWRDCVLCQATRLADANLPPAEVHAYCRPHAGMFLRSSPESFEQLARWAVSALDLCLAHGKTQRPGRVVKDSSCPGCLQRAALTGVALATVANAPTERLREAWFCVPHLPLVLERTAREAAVVILRKERELLGRLHWELREYFRKSDYRFHDEPRGSEQTAWLRAADVLAGSYPADFGYGSESDSAKRAVAWTSL